MDRVGVYVNKQLACYSSAVARWALAAKACNANAWRRLRLPQSVAYQATRGPWLHAVQMLCRQKRHFIT
jgi:hypothetical protein